MNPRPIVSGDQECWVQDRIATAIRMALEIRRVHRVAADDLSYHYGLGGIIEGTAIEIIRELGMDPAYVNVRKPGDPARTERM